jgi:hypothetical protein
MTTNAAAQVLSLGPQIGYQKARDAEDGKLMGGAALRVQLASNFKIEGAINYRQEKFAGGNLTVRSWPVTVTGLIYPLPIVYGSLGAGWYNTRFEYASSNPRIAVEDTRQEVGWHFGGGVELPLGKRTKLVGDLRYVFLNYDFDQVPGVQLDSDFYMLTVGLQFGL